jgi:hypothetical protein
MLKKLIIVANTMAEGWANIERCCPHDVEHALSSVAINMAEGWANMKRLTGTLMAYGLLQAVAAITVVHI